MKIESLKTSEDEKKTWYKLSGVDVDFANALRRTILAEIPSFAIDEIDVYENNSVFYNEYLANRLGLVPLTFDEEVGDDMKITLSINAEGPAIVYTSDLKSTDEKIKPYRETIPLAKLSSNQRLRLEAIAVKGKPKQHAKFQSVIASYNQVPKLSAKAKSLCKVHASEVGVEEGEAPQDKCEACKMDEKGELKYSEDEFIFFVESYNNVSAQDHLNKAVKILTEQAEGLEKEFK